MTESNLWGMAPQRLQLETQLIRQRGNWRYALLTLNYYIMTTIGKALHVLKVNRHSRRTDSDAAGNLERGAQKAQVGILSLQINLNVFCVLIIIIMFNKVALSQS